ncbi:MAG: YcfL family protein [Achromobacter sp.]|nr:YcfL family protein [Achromobacter sp.]
MKIVVQSAAALVLGFALAAQAGAQANPAPSYAASPGIAAKLMVRDSVRDLRVESLRSQRRNDVMVVQAEIANTSGLNSRLYYRFRWLDADGMQVGDDEAWKPLTFLNRQNQMIKGVAISPQATDFRIEMSAESP